jgi:predicted dienelactone hydrolase
VWCQPSFVEFARLFLPTSVEEMIMHYRWILWLIVLSAAVSLCASIRDVQAAEYHFCAFGDTSPYSVSVVDHVWFDAGRGRSVPARIYYPNGAGTENKKFPVILFSTGLGRDRDDCAYLGRHWARCGYVAVHVQHIGSDEETRQGTIRPKKNLQKAFYSPANIRNRPMDIIFVIHQLDSMQREGAAPANRCDMSRLGVAGHDFGAQTVLALAGQVLPGDFSFDEPRVKAIVAISAPVPLGQVPLELAYGNIQRPCLHITGTADNSIVGTTQASQRRLPFDHISGADQYLITLYGADHMTCSGHLRAANATHDAMYQRMIAESTAVYWDAYLKEDPAAKTWLADGPMEKHLGSMGWMEKKLAGGMSKNQKETAEIQRLRERK